MKPKPLTAVRSNGCGRNLSICAAATRRSSSVVHGGQIDADIAGDPHAADRLGGELRALGAELGDRQAAVDIDQSHRGREEDAQRRVLRADLAGHGLGEQLAPACRLEPILLMGGTGHDRQSGLLDALVEAGAQAGDGTGHRDPALGKLLRARRPDRPRRSPRAESPPSPPRPSAIFGGIGSIRTSSPLSSRTMPRLRTTSVLTSRPPCTPPARAWLPARSICASTMRPPCTSAARLSPMPSS